MERELERRNSLNPGSVLPGAFSFFLLSSSSLLSPSSSKKLLLSRCAFFLRPLAHTHAQTKRSDDGTRIQTLELFEFGSLCFLLLAFFSLSSSSVVVVKNNEKLFLTFSSLRFFFFRPPSCCILSKHINQPDRPSPGLRRETVVRLG